MKSKRKKVESLKSDFVCSVLQVFAFIVEAAGGTSAIMASSPFSSRILTGCGSVETNVKLKPATASLEV